MREILLGFDARGRGAHKYGSMYLLRDDVDRVLSVDTMLWPSVAENAPEWIGANNPLWEDLENLERHLPSSSLYTLIAVTWHIEPGEGAGMIGPYEGPTTPANRDANWTLLGYDVADPGISGLSNCGYSEEERRRLAPVWGRRLNSHHLFDNLEHAFEFRAITNTRVPEHAPFFVIGLWLIREVQQEFMSH
jgi:hypothetical protein